MLGILYFCFGAVSIVIQPAILLTGGGAET
jgi:hypothetical protein